MDERRDIASAPGYGFPADAKGFLFPPIAWVIFFVAVYSVQGAACASGLGVETLRLVLAIITTITAAAIVAVGVWSALVFWRIRHEQAERDDAVRQSRFLAEGTALSAGLFFVATLWIGVPIAWTSACGG